jgi:hypothetical protein
MRYSLVGIGEIFTSFSPKCPWAVSEKVEVQGISASMQGLES